jgi:hypothetical protein
VKPTRLRVTNLKARAVFSYTHQTQALHTPSGEKHFCKGFCSNKPERRTSCAFALEQSFKQKKKPELSFRLFQRADG